MFQFTAFALHGYVFTMQYPCGWVSPFGHCGINACCQLPRTFRRLPRPSSPLTAKASTVCAYSLDHITPSCLGMTRIPANGTTYHYFNKAARAARLSLYDTLWTFVSNARYIPIFKEHAPTSTSRHSMCVCAHHSEWWVWEDSNHRPHPYQGCALTT